MTNFGRRKALALFAGVPAAAALVGVSGLPAQQAHAASEYPSLKVGSTGGNVKALQHLLTKAGHAAAADGSYGENTKTAVQAFQKKKGLVVDGIAGPKTWEKVVVTTKSGEKGDHVKAVQVEANTFDKGLVVDGSFGDATKAAIMAIQGEKNLVSDGVVGPKTWVVLVGGGTGDGGGGDGGSGYGGLSSTQLGHCRTIIGIGKGYDIPEYGWVIAIATALQESTLRNLSGGDRDSVGLFQQRPSTGWGSVAQCTTPTLASRAFYGLASHTSNPGLSDISGWQSMSVAQAAQAVQRSAFPDAYAKWESLAREIVAKQKGAAGAIT